MFFINIEDCQKFKYEIYFKNKKFNFKFKGKKHLLLSNKYLNNIENKFFRI